MIVRPGRHLADGGGWLALGGGDRSFVNPAEGIETDFAKRGGPRVKNIARAAQFLEVPGLLWKIWLDGAEERRAGGIYLFEDRAAAETYANGPIAARMRANPDIGELDIRIFDVRERMSEITRAPLPHLRAAAE